MTTAYVQVYIRILPSKCDAFIICHLGLTQGVVAESVEREPPMREIRNSVSGRVKPMTYKTDTCHFLALIGKRKDSLSQCQNNVTEWDIRSWQIGLPVGQYY